MTRTATLVVLALVSGCAYTPSEFREAGARSTHRLSQSAPDATRCMARNTEEFFAGNQPDVREIGSDGSRELLIRIAGTGLFAAIAEVMPTKSGSVATIWLTPNPLYRKDELIPAMIRGC